MKQIYKQACKKIFLMWEILESYGFNPPYWLKCKENNEIPFDSLNFTLCNEASHVILGSFPEEWYRKFDITLNITIQLSHSDMSQLFMTFDDSELEKELRKHNIFLQTWGDPVIENSSRYGLIREFEIKILIKKVKW